MSPPNDTDEAESDNSYPTKYDRDTAADPDLDMTYQEAIESDRFRHAKVFTTEGEPDDKDIGQLRLDYDDPETPYALVIYPDDTEPAHIDTATISKVTYPEGEQPENGGLI